MSQDDDRFTLYKFRKINANLLSCIINNCLYFCPPEKLNDPFDCQIDLTMLVKHVRPRLKDNRLKLLGLIPGAHRLRECAKRVGVFSASRSNLDPRMWSHYADEHRGACLTYEFVAKDLLPPKFPLASAGEVFYDNSPIVEFIKEEASIHDEEAFVAGIIHRYFKTKDKAWAYEQESRIIRQEAGVHVFEKSSLKLSQVVFGLNTSKSDKDLVMRLARDYADCQSFHHCVRDGSEFGFSIESLSF